MDANSTSASDVSNALQQGPVIEGGIELATASVDSVGNQVSNYVSQIDATQIKEDGANVAQKVAKHGNNAALAAAGIGGAAVLSASQQSGEALAALKDVPVENFEFPPGISIPAVDFSIIDNGTKSLVGGAMKFIGSPAIEATASSAADLCSKLAEYVPLDLAKFEIIRDFYQILG